MNNPLCIVTLAALSALPVAAQQPLADTTFILGEGNPVPTESYGMTTVADLDGDGFEDMAVLVGQDLMLLFSPALYEVLVPGILSGINDLVGVPGDLTYGPDALAVVGTQGAGLLEWDGSQFTHRIVGAGWAGALRVDVVPRVSGQARRLVGVMADGLTVRRLTENLQNPLGPWNDVLVCTLQESIQELALVNFDGVRKPEIGLMTASGVDIRSWRGVPVTAFNFLGDTVALNTIRGTGPAQWLALLGNDQVPWGNQFMAVVGPNGLIRSDSFMADPVFVGMTAAELNPDGYGLDDLILSYKQAHNVVYLENSGDEITGPSFDPTLTGSMRFVPMGLAGPALDNEATPASTDFDNDGDDDILHPIQRDGTFFVLLSGRIDQEAQKPSIDTRMPPRFIAGPTIELDMTILADSSVTTTAGTLPNVLEVYVYRRPDLDSPMEVVPMFSARYPVADAIPGDTGEIYFPCTIPLTEVPVLGCTHFEAMYFAVARLAVDVNGVITERCPSKLLGIQGQLEGENAEFLGDHSSSPDERVTFIHNCTNGPIPAPDLPDHTGYWPGIEILIEILNEEVGGSGDELDCLPKPTAGNNPPKLFGS